MTHSFDRAYWDERWRDDHEGGATSMGSSPPSPYLATELGDLLPGTALDAGCGAGAEALWLAERGWQVTAVDISADALTRSKTRAQGWAPDDGMPDRVRWVEADLGMWSPDEQLDLVMTHYAHPAMPQLDFYRRIAAWVAPGGTLLIVGHRHAEESTGAGHRHQPRSSHEPGDVHGSGHGHDKTHVHDEAHESGHRPPPEATVTAADVAATLDRARWHVVTAGERPRTMVGPGGHEVTLDDVVVRAVRRW